MKKIKEYSRKLLYTDSQIQITGKDSVLVDGCKKIMEYNDILVKVKTREMVVSVWGSGLYVSEFGTDTIYIYGKIKSVELE